MSPVAEAALAYEARWSYAALARVDIELRDRFEEQRHLYWTAMRSGDEEDIAEQGAAMIRAYTAITRAMEAQPDDAYIIGQHGKLKIAIGRTNAPATKLDGVVYLTADEVAALLSEKPEFSTIAEIKMLWPGATVAPADTVEGFGNLGHAEVVISDGPQPKRSLEDDISDLGVTLEETW